MQQLDVGETTVLTSHWYDRDGNGVEPTDITLTVTHPDGTVDTYDKVPDLTQGDTTADWWRAVIGSAAGLWRYSFTGTINTDVVEQGGSFLVDADIRSGSCEPWTTWDEVTACTAATLTALTGGQQEAAIDQASEMLFNLTGRVYPGICETTRSLCWACRTCSPMVCGCEPSDAVDLGWGFPVWSVWDVIVDGETLAPDAYRLLNRRWLQRVEESWPSGLAVHDPSAWRASWAYGRPVPVGGRRAASLLAAEIAKSCAGLPCQLPERVTGVSREGVTFMVLPPVDAVAGGKTGIALVDMWVATDAKGRKPRPHIFVPGAPGLRTFR